MNLSSRYLIKLLTGRGFVLIRSKGSHHVYFNPSSNKTVIVPVHNKDLAEGTFFGILKQADIDKSEL
jgi:predicted RNA binding protein YcfA (HicA-like mRNA interferase family)